jgi:hypothetical protein
VAYIEDAAFCNFTYFALRSQDGETRTDFIPAAVAA